jgi:succinate dehydrogenase/fumarate reductase flavoprotein subunit
MDLQRAQRSAFRNKKIQEVRSELQESMVKAMTKEYPETEKLLKELEETQKKMVELRRSGNQ